MTCSCRPQIGCIKQWKRSNGKTIQVKLIRIIDRRDVCAWECHFKNLSNLPTNKLMAEIVLKCERCRRKHNARSK